MTPVRVKLALGSVSASLVLATALPADARYVSTDSTARYQISDFCSLGACSSPSDLGVSIPFTYTDDGDNTYQVDSRGLFGSLYIYADGIVGIGKPLPAGATVGNVASLGDSWVAPGFWNYTDLNRIDVSFMTTDPQGPSPAIDAVQISWILNDDTIFGVSLQQGQYGFCDDFDACFDYGALDAGWFPDSTPYLPNGALIGYRVGSSYSSMFYDPNRYDLTNSNYQFNISIAGVPEPGAWALLSLGFGLAGFGLRSRRRLTA